MHLLRCKYAAVVKQSSFLFGGSGGGSFLALDFIAGTRSGATIHANGRNSENVWGRSEVGVGRMHSHTHAYRQTEKRTYCREGGVARRVYAGHPSDQTRRKETRQHHRQSGLAEA